MRKTTLWNLYVAAYTLIFGAPLLFFPTKIPLISFAAHEEAWVRITGMCLLAFSFFNLVIRWEFAGSTMQTGFFCQAGFVAVLSILVWAGYTPLLYVIIWILLVGFIGSSLTLC